MMPALIAIDTTAAAVRNPRTIASVRTRFGSPRRSESCSCGGRSERSDTDSCPRRGGAEMIADPGAGPRWEDAEAGPDQGGLDQPSVVPTVLASQVARVASSWSAGR